jgi:hypothetical protein
MRLRAFLPTASRGAASGPLTELLAKISRGGIASIPMPPVLNLQRLNGGGRSSRRLAGRLPGAKDGTSFHPLIN